MEITEFDFWMLRDWWRNLKDRYDISGTGSSGSASSTAGPTSALYTLAPTPSTPVIPTGGPTGGFPTPTGAFPTFTPPTGTIPTEAPGAGPSGPWGGNGGWGGDGGWGGNGGWGEGSDDEEGGSWWGSLFGGN